MALTKSTFLHHLKTLSGPCSHLSPSFVCLRLLSFAIPEEAAAERRKCRLRIEPPVSSLRQSHPKQKQQQSRSPPNPNAPKIPENVAVLTGNRLNLHNRILTLIRQNDLEEADLLTRHSIYSNCRPTIFTCNAVMAALLRQSRYSELLSLHRFINQAGVAANLVTHNLLINTYVDCRKIDLALENYKLLINEAPFNPSPTTYRILIKGLVDNNEVEKAMELKDEMLSKGFNADPIVYNYLMNGQVKNSNPDGVFALYDELKEKLGGPVTDGVVFGSLMKAYFLKGMEKEAMGCYEEALSEDSEIKMGAVAFNSVLDALTKNGKIDDAQNLFYRMLAEHKPPIKLTVNLGSYNVMVDAYCALGWFIDAIDVFHSMDEKRIRPDTLSYNNLIEQLCNNGKLAEAEELYQGMNGKGVSPDEVTFVLLMDTCFKENRPDDAAQYFRTMVDSKLRPNLTVYNKLLKGLVEVGKVDEAKSFYDLMVGKLEMDDASYEFMMKALFEIGKGDAVLQMVGGLLRDEGLEFSSKLQEFVKGELSKEGRVEELVKLMEDVERVKAEAVAKGAEAAEKAKASARAAISSLIPGKLFRNKEREEKSAYESDSAGEVTGGTGDDIAESSLGIGSPGGRSAGSRDFV